jgi:hypothetical protein
MSGSCTVRVVPSSKVSLSMFFNVPLMLAASLLMQKRNPSPETSVMYEDAFSVSSIVSTVSTILLCSMSIAVCLSMLPLPPSRPQYQSPFILPFVLSVSSLFYAVTNFAAVRKSNHQHSTYALHPNHSLGIPSL